MLSGRRPSAGSWQHVLDALLPFLVAGFEAPTDVGAPDSRRRGAA
jgi:hypothetical protein